MVRFGEERMKKALVILNEAKERGLIKDYAIAGGIASIYYSEAFWTLDVDIFVTIKSGFITGKSIEPIQIYDYFASKGYDSDGDYISIDGLLLHLIFVDSGIELDAVWDAESIEFGGIKTQILKVEYIIAICSKVRRGKDLYKIRHLTEQCKIDKILLDKILKKYNLHNPLEEKCRKHLK